MEFTSRSTIELKREFVERAEAYLRERVGTQVPLSRVSRVIGLSERSLRNAFYGVRGMSPTRYMRAERLEGVRRTLRDRSTAALTVTAVASRYGFSELGRFAAAYKQAFGEAPSQTRRASLQSEARNPHGRKG